MKYYCVFKIILLFSLALSSNILLAQTTCSTIFPDAISSADNSSTLQMRSSSRVFDSPDGVLDTTSSDFHPSSRCDSSICTISNSVVPKLNYTQGFPSGRPNLDVGFQVTQTVSPGNYDRAFFGTESVVTMQAGTYVFESDFRTQADAQIILDGAGPVIIYIQGDLIIGGDSIINTDQNNTIYFFTQSDADFGSGVDFTGLVYAKGEFELGSRSLFEGAASAEGDISLGFRSEMTFNASIASSTDTGGLCTSGSGSGPQLASIAISVSTTSASVCSPVEVTIVVFDDNGDVFTGFDGTIDLSAPVGNGDWSKTATATDALGTLTTGGIGSGSASYTFDTAGGDNGEITLNFSNTRLQTVSLQAQDTSTGVSDTVAGINFSDNEFNFVDVTGFNNDTVAGRDHTFLVQMLKLDAASGSCGVATDYSVDNVKMWYERHFADPNGVPPIIRDDDGVEVTIFNAEPGNNNISANFVNGESTIIFKTSDVARIRLRITDDSNTFADQDISGVSSTLVVRPFGMHLSVTSNPQASDHTGPIFVSSGEGFTITARAVGWSASDDIDSDGDPDGHNDVSATNNADLSDNATLVSFGQEMFFPESLSVIAIPISPSIIIADRLSDGPLSGDGTVISAFNNGIGSTSDVFYADVGVIQVYAGIRDGFYIGASNARTSKIFSASGYVGRFYPFAFELTSSTVDEQCTTGLDFTYMGGTVQPTFVINAVNLQGNTTSNYEGNYAKLIGDNTDVSFGIRDIPTGTDLTSRFSYFNSSTGGWNSGQLSVTMSLRDARTGMPDGPFTQAKIGILPTDSDGVTFANSDLDLDTNADSNDDFQELGESEQRFGRVRLGDAFGPETANLPVEFVVEYWNGSFWELNVDDGCTTLPLSAVSYPNGTIDTAQNKTVVVGGGTTEGIYPDATASQIQFIDGVAEHFFTAPGAGNTGSFSVDIDITSRWWLGFDWNQDGDYLETNLPTARYQFGSYRGHDRIIHWQEVF